MLNADLGVGCGANSGGCASSGECQGVPDLCIKRHDTRPAFKISLTDCDGVVDLTDENLALEASMWFDAKLKTSITNSSGALKFADNIGFDQVLVGDVILAGRVRNSEKMLVTAIDEEEKSVTVQRAYGGTSASSWEKGTALKIFKFFDQPAEIESFYEETTNIEGSVSNELTDTSLVFNWSPGQTSMPGCYWLEFKLLMISPNSGDVEWTKRIPLASDGFLIRIIDSPTSPE